MTAARSRNYFLGPPESIEQRSEMAFIVAPPRNRTVVDRLAHLPVTDGGYGPLGTMEVQAGQYFDCRPRNSIRRRPSPSISPTQGFIVHLHHAVGKHMQPVRCQPLNLAASSAAFDQIICKGHQSVSKQLGSNRTAKYPRVPAAEDDFAHEETASQSGRPGVYYPASYRPPGSLLRQGYAAIRCARPPGVGRRPHRPHERDRHVALPSRMRLGWTLCSSPAPNTRE